MDENKTFKLFLINNKKLLLIVLLGVSFLLLVLYYLLFIPFNKKDNIIHISMNQSINSVSKSLEAENIVRDDLVLKFFIKVFKKGKGIIPGDYLIEKNSPVWIVAWQISRGHHNIEALKITIREGLNNEQIADLFESQLVNFDKELFLSFSYDKQGYLFPDTYFFFSMETTEEIIKKLSDNFYYRTKDLPFNLSNKKLSDIIIMASILEGEASGKEDIGIISGILWKRVSMGMPLQVDVEKSTYENKGLPQRPLNNPGLLSIRSALLPISSSYLYYIHDKNGLVHYAKTFEEHKKNIEIYLK